MNRLLALASIRALRHHPWQLALALLGIALGVGMVVAVQLTQESARQALVDQRAETALVWRQDWSVRVRVVDSSGATAWLQPVFTTRYRERAAP